MSAFREVYVLFRMLDFLLVSYVGCYYAIVVVISVRSVGALGATRGFVWFRHLLLESSATVSLCVCVVGNDCVCVCGKRVREVSFHSLPFGCVECVVSVS